MQTDAQKLEAVEASLRRWQTRLTRAVNAINKLERKRRRLAGPVKPKSAAQLVLDHVTSVNVRVPRALLPKPVPDVIPLPELDAFFLPALPDKSEQANPDLTIPPMLKRTMADRTRDELAARTEVEADPVVKKVNRARLARMDEKRRGRSRFSASDMPLSGRDAMKAIKDARRKK